MYLGKKLQNQWMAIFLENGNILFLDTVEPALNITLPIPIR
jgi:hypothetical protein